MGCLRRRCRTTLGSNDLRKASRLHGLHSDAFKVVLRHVLEVAHSLHTKGLRNSVINGPKTMLHHAHIEPINTSATVYRTRWARAVVRLLHATVARLHRVRRAQWTPAPVQQHAPAGSVSTLY